MGFFWFWVMLILFALMLAAVPTWPYSRSWGYGASGGAFVALLLILGLFWFGFLAVWWPLIGIVYFY
ncbi:MAG: DUF3309 family protein [Pseudolabrys sp.]